MKKIGLILQGGGMRGVYTAGVLDYFMEKELYFPYVALSLLVRRMVLLIWLVNRALARIMHIDYLHDPRFVGIRNLFTKRSLFGSGFYSR